jgi:hypothetical protein
VDIVSNDKGHASVAIYTGIYTHITSMFMEKPAQKIENQLVGIIKPRPRYD